MPSVLVIDDCPQMRRFVRRVLEKEGYDVREAGDGPEGVKAYEYAPADVVLCDVFMPGQDGLGVLRSLRRRFPGVRVLMMSGGGRVVRGDFLPQAVAMGAAGVLGKPFGTADLAEALAEALAS